MVACGILEVAEAAQHQNIVLALVFSGTCSIQLIGLREKIKERPISHLKIYGFLMFPVDVPLSQPIE